MPHRLEQLFPDLLAHAQIVDAAHKLSPVHKRLVEVVEPEEAHLPQHLVDGGQPVCVRVRVCVYGCRVEAERGLRSGIFFHSFILLDPHC